MLKTSTAEETKRPGTAVRGIYYTTGLEGCLEIVPAAIGGEVLIWFCIHMLVRAHGGRLGLRLVRAGAFIYIATVAVL